MRGTQSDYDEEVQSFHRWREDTGQPGLDGQGPASKCSFIPRSAVKKYFEDTDTVERVLSTLLDEEDLHAGYIHSHYLRTLAILLCMGEGQMIKHFVKYTSLEDHRLPYRTRPEDFPRFSDHDRQIKFFESFNKHQWQFCATGMAYDMDLDLHEDEILPITDKEEIGEGGNAVVYKITLHKDYDLLLPPNYKSPVRLCPVKLCPHFLTNSRSLVGIKIHML